LKMATPRINGARNSRTVRVGVRVSDLLRAFFPRRGGDGAVRSATTADVSAAAGIVRATSGN